METPLKAGILYVQHFKFGKKSWRKVWAQLFATSPCGIARLEICDVRDDGSGPEKMSLRKCERRVVRLADCVSVGPADAHSCPKDTAAFYLNTMEKSYVLAAERQDEWIAQLCQLAFQGTNEPAPSSPRDRPGPDLHVEENTLYSSWQDLNEFPVQVHKTDAAARCGLSGSYLLAALPKGLVLKTPQSRQTLLTWPYPFLRKFGHNKALFSFEAGRRCDSGEGIFTLATSRAAELCTLVSAAIARQSSSLLGRSSAYTPEPLSSSPCPEPRLWSSQSLEETLPPWTPEDSGRSPVPAELYPGSGQALPCALEPGSCAGAGAEPPIVYASIHRGLQPPLEPWGEAKPEQDVARASGGQGLRASEHLYENLCPLGRSCSMEEEPSRLGSRGSPEGSSTAPAPIYDNSCMVSKRWSSPLGPSTGPSPSLEAQYRRLLGQEGQEEGEEREEDALVSSLSRARVNSGFRKLVTLLSREVAPKLPGKSSSTLDQA